MGFERLEPGNSAVIGANWGFAAEHLFAAECLARDYHVYRSLSPVSRWDFVVNGKNVDVKGIGEGVRPRGHLHGMDDLRVDIVAVCRMAQKLWYIVPRCELPSGKQVSFTWSQQEQWINRWGLLDA